ncbi:hypothetical protein KAJ27_18745 [bacterium]|nr:hypothetical protein [bacterium]
MPDDDGDPTTVTYRGYGYFSVNYNDGSPVVNQQVSLNLSLNFYLMNEFENVSRTVSANTNSNGYAYIMVSITVPDWYGPPVDHLLSTSSLPNAGECCNILGTQYHYFWNTFTANSNYEYRYFDCDEDDLCDYFEEDLAERFKPVIHKHSYEVQQQLGNFEESLIKYNGSSLKAYNINGSEYYSSTISNDAQLHVWNSSDWNLGSYAVTQDNKRWKLNFPDTDQRHAGASIGERPVYYHVYKEGNYYYLQYWLYWDMNDLRYHNQTSNQTWHEGDWEHVTIRLNSNLQPDYVNFYNHYGGRTRYASQCWWSELPVSTYALATQGWNPESNHLNIWVAANGHAIYNRYDTVYKLMSSFEIDELYIDNVDYNSSGNDLYFEYDKLEKMGKCYENSNISGVHGHTYYPHYEIKGGKHWLAYVGRVGDYWTSAVTATYSPKMPPFRTNVEWRNFTMDTSGFGNEIGFFKDLAVEIYWVNDSVEGD